MSLIPTRTIKNPYVLALGISKYDNTNVNNLPTAKQDILNVKDLFTTHYKYKHVHSFIDEVKYTFRKKLKIAKPTKSHIDKLIKEHSMEVDGINDEIKDKKKKIDGFIFVFSGHGNSLAIVGCDNSKYSRTKIHGQFDNDSVTSLAGYPKIFIYDCCRGSDTDNFVNKNSKDTEKESIHKVTVNQDIYYWYATSDEYQAFENKKTTSGYFLGELCKYMRVWAKQNRYYPLNEIDSFIRNKVIAVSGGTQTPSSVTKLTYKTFIQPFNSKTQTKETLSKMPNLTSLPDESDSDVTASKFSYSVRVPRGEKLKVSDLLKEIKLLKGFMPSTYSQKDLDGGGIWISGVEKGFTYSVCWHPTKEHKAIAIGKTKMYGGWVAAGQVATSIVTSSIWGNKTRYDIKHN